MKCFFKKLIILLFIILLVSSSFAQQKDLDQNVNNSSIPDSLNHVDSLSKYQKFRVYKRDINPEHQLKTGAALMFFLIIIMSLSNNYNPS